MIDAFPAMPTRWQLVYTMRTLGYLLHMNRVSACLAPIAALYASAASKAHRVALVPKTTSLSAAPN